MDLSNKKNGVNHKTNIIISIIRTLHYVSLLVVISIIRHSSCTDACDYISACVLDAKKLVYMEYAFCV